MPFYAVRRGKEPGVYDTWKECQQQTVGFGGAQFNKFDTKEDAEEFVTVAKLPSKKKADGDKTDDKKSKTKSSSAKRVKDESESDDSDSDSPPPAKKPAAGKAAGKKSKSESADGDSSSKSAGEAVFVEGLCTFQGKTPVTSGGVFWSKDSPNNISERLTISGKPTAQRAEFHAAIRAVKQAKKLGKSAITIYSSSSNLVQSMGTWLKGWKKNDFKTSAGSDVKNKEDIIALDKATEGISVSWALVGSAEEENKKRAVQLAKKAPKT